MHCGDHRASETAGFMKELNIGLGSDAYKWHTVVGKNHNQLGGIGFREWVLPFIHALPFSLSLPY